MIEISQATSQDQGGGFGTNGFVTITGGSLVSISDAQAASYGGAFFAKGDLTIADGSELLIDSVAGGKDSGGFQVSGVEVSDQSLLSISGAVANGFGGAFGSTTFRVQDSNVIITDSKSGEMGGGFLSLGDVLISNSSLHVARPVLCSKRGGRLQCSGCPAGDPEFCSASARCIGCKRRWFQLLGSSGDPRL